MIGSRAVHPVPRHPDGRPPVISSGFRTTDRPNHNGVDIMYKRLPSDGGPPSRLLLPSHAPRFFMPPGVPALAIAAGEVSRSEQISTGGYLVIEHEGGVTSQYMHLFNLRVREGQHLRAGEVVGEIGFDPSFKLLHLHFQLRTAGALIDPLETISTLEVVDHGARPKWLIAASMAFVAGLALSVPSTEW